MLTRRGLLYNLGAAGLFVPCMPAIVNINNIMKLAIPKKHPLWTFSFWVTFEEVQSFPTTLYIDQYKRYTDQYTGLDGKREIINVFTTKDIMEIEYENEEVHNYKIKIGVDRDKLFPAAAKV